VCFLPFKNLLFFFLCKYKESLPPRTLKSAFHLQRIKGREKEYIASHLQYRMSPPIPAYTHTHTHTHTYFTLQVIKYRCLHLTIYTVTFDSIFLAF
jgi:hypothetical protein